jgi:hypothetical protein
LTGHDKIWVKKEKHEVNAYLGSTSLKLQLSLKFQKAPPPTAARGHTSPPNDLEKRVSVVGEK